MRYLSSLSAIDEVSRAQDDRESKSRNSFMKWAW